MSDEWRRRLGGAVSAIGVGLAGLSLFFAVILFGGAISQGDPGGAVFVLLFGLVPTAVGVGLAHLGTPGYWRRPVVLPPDLWRRPGVIGLAIALVTIALVLVFRSAAAFIALAALCLYPVLDVPPILARPSWWRAAVTSFVVWLVAFGVVTELVDSIQHLRESMMVFLVPFMMYPLALAISGLVRIERRVRGRPPESGVRITAIVGAVACGSLVIVPVTLNTIPFLMEKLTGDTPTHTVYTGDGDVVSAAPGQVTVRLGSRTEAFQVGSQTKYGFRGPGSPQVKGSPGPDWLKPGQKVGLEYVHRGGVAVANEVDIWIERKGCKGDPKWTAAVSAPSSPTTLAGTIWESRVGSPEPAGSQGPETFEFLEAGHFAYTQGSGPRDTNAAWRQDGAAVLIQVNDCYAEYEGRIDGDRIEGQFTNEMGYRAAWTAHRTLVAAR